MATEFLKEYIGLVCQVAYPNDIGGEVAELIAVDGDWIKIGTGGKEKLVNTRLVRSIAPMPEKYQEKYRRKQDR